MNTQQPPKQQPPKGGVMPQAWRNALNKAQDAMIEVGRTLYVDNRPISNRDINMACQQLSQTTARCYANGMGALEAFQQQVEADEKMPSGVQVVLLLGVAELEKELEELEGNENN